MATNQGIAPVKCAADLDTWFHDTWRRIFEPNAGRQLVMRLWDYYASARDIADISNADAKRYCEAYRELHEQAIAGVDRERVLEKDRNAWRQQCDELSTEVARLVRENANPVSAAYETLGGTLQKIVACAGGKIELDPDAVRSCNGAFLASIPTLAGGLILVNAVKPGALSNGKET